MKHVLMIRVSFSFVFLLSFICVLVSFLNDTIRHCYKYMLDQVHAGPKVRYPKRQKRGAPHASTPLAEKKTKEKENREAKRESQCEF